MPRRRSKNVTLDNGATGAPRSPSLPVAPPGLPYGERQAAEAAVAAVPLAGPQVPTVSPTPPPADPLAAVAGYQPPNLGLLGPTQRPGEPVTAGLPSGPGAGPEAIAPMPGTLSSTFDTLASATGDPIFGQLATRARMQGR